MNDYETNVMFEYESIKVVFAKQKMFEFHLIHVITPNSLLQANYKCFNSTVSGIRMPNAEHEKNTLNHDCDPFSCSNNCGKSKIHKTLTFFLSAETNVTDCEACLKSKSRDCKNASTSDIVSI